jgi:predicted transcriptional regulator
MLVIHQQNPQRRLVMNGEQFKQWRKKYRIARAYLAKHSNVPYKLISVFEDDNTPLRPREYDAICSVVRGVEAKKNAA